MHRDPHRPDMSARRVVATQCKSVQLTQSAHQPAAFKEAQGRRRRSSARNPIILSVGRSPLVSPNNRYNKHTHKVMHNLHQSALSAAK